MKVLSTVSAFLAGVQPSGKKLPDTPSTSLQPPLFTEANSSDKEASAPDMSIMSQSKLTHLTEDSVPSVAQAAAHLLLMDAMWVWKHNVTTGEIATKLLALFPTSNRELQASDEKTPRQILAGLMEAAVPRFYKWWFMVHRQLSRTIPEKGFLELSADILPPLDVMIIWHAYMLQPAVYADDCSRLEVPNMRRVLFPWQALVNAIDSRTAEYHLPIAAREFSETHSGQSTDLVEELCAKKHILAYDITCRHCNIEKRVPIIDIAQTEDLNQGFELECDCGYIPSVDALRSDFLHLRRTGEMHLRGTFLSSSLGQALYPLATALPEPILNLAPSAKASFMLLTPHVMKAIHRNGQ